MHNYLTFASQAKAVKMFYHGFADGETIFFSGEAVRHHLESGPVWVFDFVGEDGRHFWLLAEAFELVHVVPSRELNHFEKMQAAFYAELNKKTTPARVA